MWNKLKYVMYPKMVKYLTKLCVYTAATSNVLNIEPSTIENIEILSCHFPNS